MSYIGSSAAPLPVAFSGPQSEGFDGGTATFTLSRSVAKVTDIEVVINNVPQSPYDGSYSVSGSTLTTSETVSAGTKNVIVKYRDVSLGSLTPLNGSISKAKVDVANLDGTGAAQMPVGSTAQRPSMPLAGHYRMNSTTGEPEWYDVTAARWQPFRATVYDTEYLVVAGGGGTSGGSSEPAGGGGAGGMLTGTLSIPAGSVFTITVGAGGAGIVGNTPASNGANSVLSRLGYSDIAAIGGGRGGNGSGGAGNSGGSGGGSSGWSGPAGGSGTAGQGNNGGAGGAFGSGGGYASGGGGGKSAAGVAAASNKGGDGGAGMAWPTGSSNYYAGGGGGGTLYTGSTGIGGIGGGGNGCASALQSSGNSGTANTGGGGGAANGLSGVGGSGGSGTVIIRYFGTPRGNGGTITQTGGYTYHTFTSSGTFTA